MNSLQIFSFVGFTLLVAVITWWKVRKTDTGSQQGYFLAGRSLKAPVIAASLMLTNLSTEQLVGLSGTLQAHEHQALVWCSPEEALQYPLAPADIPLLEAFMALRAE